MSARLNRKKDFPPRRGRERARNIARKKAEEVCAADVAGEELKLKAPKPESVET